jgi:hypothetical protein
MVNSVPDWLRSMPENELFLFSDPPCRPLWRPRLYRVARVLEHDRHDRGLVRRRRPGQAVEVQLHGQLEVRREP